ncbi:hypothetical protein GCM10027422_23220 [Hymenobacter arcticus]
MIDEFEQLLLKMASDDAIEPQVTLDIKLNSLPPRQRVQCMTYLLNEFKSGRLDKEGGIWHQRYDEPFFWNADISDDEMDSRSIVDRTMGKLCDILVNYVPCRLHDEKALLNSLINCTVDKQDALVQLGASLNISSEDELIPHKEAAAFLGISASTLYQKNKTELLRPLTPPGSNTNWYPKKNLIAYKAKMVTKPRKGNHTDDAKDNSPENSEVDLKRYYRKRSQRKI